MMTLSATATVVFYGTYAAAATTHRHIYLMPMVVFGICRYLLLVLQHHQGGEPDRMVYRDRPLLATVTVWLVATVFVLYGEALVG